MTVSGLAGSPSRCCVWIPVCSSRSLCKQVSKFSCTREPTEKIEVLRLGRYCTYIIRYWSLLLFRHVKDQFSFHNETEVTGVVLNEDGMYRKIT